MQKFQLIMLNNFKAQNLIVYCSKRKRSGSSEYEMSNKTSRMAKEPPDLPPDDGTTERAEDTSRDVGLPSDVVDSVGGLVEDETPARRDEMMSDVEVGMEDVMDNVGQQGGQGVWARRFAAAAAASTRRTTRSLLAGTKGKMRISLHKEKKKLWMCIKDGKTDMEELRKYLQHGVMQWQLDELVSVLHEDWTGMSSEERQEGYQALVSKMRECFLPVHVDMPPEQVRLSYSDAFLKFVADAQRTAVQGDGTATDTSGRKDAGPSADVQGESRMIEDDAADGSKSVGVSEQLFSYVENSYSPSGTVKVVEARSGAGLNIAVESSNAAPVDTSSDDELESWRATEFGDTQDQALLNTCKDNELKTLAQVSSWQKRRVAAEERRPEQQGTVQISEVSGSDGTKKRKAAVPVDDGVMLNTDDGSGGDRGDAMAAP